ncbi:MAG: endonuclease/exonuclease/phosphatase family protein [Acidobacteriota bacterium]|nr:endonuclease/exonuclease/phosphatase family protein [Acidobacteriota bacterium]
MSISGNLFSMNRRGIGKTGRAAHGTQGRWARWFRRSTKLYLLLVLALWLLLHLGADRWWPATLILFGPRWVFALPLLLLAPLAFRLDRSQLLWLAAAAAVIFIPFMGLRVPLSRKGADGATIRVLTCNVGGPDMDRESLARLIRESDADIVALQECARETALKALPGWTLVTEERLVVAARVPVTRAQGRRIMHPPRQWPRASALQCVVHLPEGDLTFSSIHLPSPRQGLSNMLDRKRLLNLANVPLLKKETELRRRTAEEIEALLRPGALPAVVAGDFNMPVESAWYRRFWPAYSNAFSKAGFGYGFTEKIVLRGFEYRVRIDHILTRGDLVAERCWIGMDVGSDHLPLLAEIRRSR